MSKGGVELSEAIAKATKFCRMVIGVVRLNGVEVLGRLK